MGKVCVKRSWILPVSEPFPVMIGTASEGKNESQEHNSKDNDDLERGEPELELAEEFDAEVVDRDNNDQENGDPYSWIHFISLNPVLYDQCSSS